MMWKSWLVSLPVILCFVAVMQAESIMDPNHPVDPNDPNHIPVNGCIFGWGEDKKGVISNIPDGNDFIAIAAGKFHCVALRSDGTLTAWGSDKDGKLEVPDGNDFVQIATGSKHSIALRSDGTIAVWGDDGSGQISDQPDSNDIMAIAAGDYHSLALRANGLVIGWGGWNSFGEIDPQLPAVDTNFVAIAAGSYHSLALQSDGQVHIWGSNNDGQAQLYAGAASRIHTAISARGNYTLLVSQDDEGQQRLVAWGNGEWYPYNTSRPNYHYYQEESTEFLSISAGFDHLMALTTDGRVLKWEWPNGEDPYSWILASRDVFYVDPNNEGDVWPLCISAGNEYSLVLGQLLPEE